MKKWHVALAVVVLLESGLPVSAQTYDTVVQHGPSANRVDIVFIGDGYTASQIGTIYPQHVQSQIDYIFQSVQEPFPRYEKFFNVHRVNLISNESGADKPPLGVFVDTALDASYWWDGVTERLLYFSDSKAQIFTNQALSGSGIDVDVRFGTVNDRKYGGGGGTWAVYAGANNSALEVALHEVGHSFGGLADEYFFPGTYTGSEPPEPNATRSPTTGKWDRWLGYVDPDTSIGPIDYYEGARYFSNGLYRPSQDSKMRSLGRSFDAISRERFISRIYAEVDPLDGWLDNSSPVIDPASVWVQTVDPDVISVAWSLDGNPLTASGDTISIGSLGLPAGTYQLTARAYDQILDHAFTGDSLDWYRLPNTSPLQQSVHWNLVISAKISGDFDGDGDYDCSDIDALVAEIAAGGNGSTYDLTRDGLVNLDDRNAWLAEAGRAQLPSNQPYLVGDADLSGAVDGTDFNIWNVHKFDTITAWCSGDFNADGQIDGTDFNLWNINKFMSADTIRAVPEPSGLGRGLVVAAIGFLGRMLHRRGNS